MNEGESSQKPRGGKLALRCAWLIAAMTIAFMGLGAYLGSQHGAIGWAAAGIAAGVSTLGATIAMFLTALFPGPTGAVNGLLLGMLARMGLPLATGVILAQRSEALAAAGVFPGLVACYLIGLVVETLLVLPLVSGKSGSAKAL